jgi:hypothetical protein
LILRHIITRFGFKIDAAKLDRLTKQIDAVAGRVSSLAGGDAQLAASADKAAKSVEGVAEATKQVATETDQASAATVAWGNVLGNIATQALGVLREWAGEAALAGDVAAKQAQQIGLTAEAYQELAHAAGLSGTDINTLSNAMQQLAKRARNAQVGQKKAVEAYRELGISVTDSSGELKSQEQLLAEVADRFAGMENGTQKTAVAMELFGRAGTQLIPMLNAGSEGIQEMRNEAQELGIVMSDEAAANSEKYQDAMARLEGVLVGLRNTIVAGITPAITNVAQGFTDWIRKGNRLEIVLTNLKRALVIVTLVTATWLALLAVQKIQAFASALVVLIARIRAMGAAALAAQLKMLLIPLAIVAIVAAIEDFIGFMQGKDSLIGRALGPEKSDALRDSVQSLGDTIMSVGTFFADVWRAITDGAEAAADAVVGAWRWAVDGLADLIGRFVDGLGVLWFEATKAGTAAAEAIEDAWASVLMTIGELFEALEGFVSRTWDSIAEGIGSAIETIDSTLTEFIDDALELWGELADAIREVLGMDDESSTDFAARAERERQAAGELAAAEADLTSSAEAAGALRAQQAALTPSLIAPTAGAGAFSIGGLAAPQRNINTSIGAFNVTLPGPPDQNLSADEIERATERGARKALEDAFAEEWANETDLVGW